MLSNDQIIEMAKQAGCTEDIVAVTCHIYGFRTAELIAFARLIEAKVREEDAQIVLSRCIGYAVDDYDLNTLAAAIRN